MTDYSLEFVADLVLRTLSKGMKEGRHHDVIRDGTLIYLAIHEDGEEAKDHMPLVYVQAAIEKLLDRQGGGSPEHSVDQVACSFCGKKRPDVRLGAGPGVFICNECVKTFSELFAVE